MPSQSLLPLPAPSLGNALNGDPAAVYDALCFIQSPATVNQLAALLAAAGLRTARDTGFHSAEVRKLLDSLAAAGLAVCGDQGRWLPKPDSGWARFVELTGSNKLREFWWNAWKAERHFEHTYGLELRDEAALVGALRVVIHAGRTQAAFDRLRHIAYLSAAYGPRALRHAILRPFDATLMARLEPKLQMSIAGLLLGTLGGNADAAEAPLYEWLFERIGTDPAAVPEHLHYRLAEWLIFCGRAADARRLLADHVTPEAQALRAALDISQGLFEAGAAAFDAAWKALGAEVGKRKNLLPESLSWFYPMALLHGAEPAQWTKARKFAAAESGKRDAASYTFWGLWQEAIDQRLGDAPRNAEPFMLEAPAHQELHALHLLHHLLLAAWLGIAPKGGAAAAARLRRHGQGLAERYVASGQRWLAALARRATALLLEEPAVAGDAAVPFFVGAAQDRWREALNSILALGAVAGSAARGAGGATDRLIWTVRTDATGRVLNIEPLEQKAGARGLGKPKTVTLAALLKRTDLASHDAAVLRAAVRDTYTQRMGLNLTQAAQALVRHPHVVWADEPLRFVELVETLPALEVMTRGEHIHFRVLDPIRPVQADEDAEDRYYLSARERQASDQRQQLLLLRDGTERARVLRITPAQLRVAELVTQGWKVPVNAKAELDAALRVLASHFQLSSDAEAGTEVAASAVLRAELTPHGSGLALRVVAAPFGDFGPRLAPGAGRERVTTVHQGVTLFTRRDLACEHEALLALARKVDFLDDGAHAWDVDEPEQALALVEALTGLAPQVVSEWPKGQPLRVRAVAAPQVKLSVASRGDWLEIDGDIALDDGEVLRLRKLLELLQQGRSRFVALGDGGFLALSDTLRQQLADLQALAQPHARGQRFSAVAAVSWAAQATGSGVAAAAITLDGDAAWRQRSAAWANAQSRAFETPSALQAELRDYQADGYRWLMRLAASGFGACLADDMGLGKTLQALALLIARASGGPALVVAPTSVCGNWLAEAARFAPGLEVLTYGDVAGVGEAGEAGDEFDEVDDSEAQATPGGPAEASDAAAEPTRDNARGAARRRQVAALEPGQVLVCSYALLQIDAAILTTRQWHSVVLDEAQAIKNAATRRARAALALNADFKLALTGTPIENRLGELWSIMGFANPGLLGSAEQFGRRFAAPIERDADVQAAKRLRRLVSPFLLRRTKGEVLTDLPPRTEIVHEVVPGARERALLEALRQQAEDGINQVITQGTAQGQAQIHMLAALTRLRRAACDPRLVAPELALIGAKVQEFERLAQELVAGRHKALVFSQFTDFLALLRERLDGAGLSYQYLDGSTPAAERTKRVAAFQAGAGDLFLISLKAGGFGLNLTMADYVIITDPWWNPAAEDQASGRAHRIGQQRPVTVYRLVTKGSIEDRIVRLHRSKRELAEGILSGQDGGGAALGAGELMALLRGGDTG